MRLKLILVGFSLFAALVPTLPIVGQISSQPWHNGIDKDYWEIGLESVDKEKMMAVWESMGKELQSEPNTWAGTYFKGGYDAGYFLRWSSTRFVLIPYFDQDLITDFSYGTVTFVDTSKVLFHPERDLRGGRSVAKTPREWTLIWNYFVPVEGLKDFGLYFAGLREYNEFNGQCCEFTPNFLSRRIDAKGTPPWYPVPLKYAHFIKRPIEGAITFIGQKRRVKNWGYQGRLHGVWMDDVILIPVRVNLGGDRRVRRNMLFRLVAQPDFTQYLQIIKPGGHTSFGYVVRDLIEGKELYFDPSNNQGKPLPLPPVQVGMKVTTSPVNR